MSFTGGGRGHAVARVLRMVVKLSQRGYTKTEYTGDHGHSTSKSKMFYRDLRAIEDAGIPVEQDGTRYSISKDFMKSFLK